LGKKFQKTVGGDFFFDSHCISAASRDIVGSGSFALAAHVKQIADCMNGQHTDRQTSSLLNPLMPTVAIWVQP